MQLNWSDPPHRWCGIAIMSGVCVIMCVGGGGIPVGLEFGISADLEFGISSDRDF